MMSHISIKTPSKILFPALTNAHYSQEIRDIDASYPSEDLETRKQNSTYPHIPNKHPTT